MRWANRGPEIDKWVLKRFQSVAGYPLPEPVLEFLQQVSNGGIPERMVALPVLRGDVTSTAFLMGLYGLDHPSPQYDLVAQMREFPHRKDEFIPIGFDRMQFRIVYVVSGEAAGQVWYVPWRTFEGTGDEDIYTVAQDMGELAHLIETAKPPF